jgi:hypothetical protein
MFYECENILCIIVIIVLIRYCISEHLDGFISYFKFVRLPELDCSCSGYVQKRVTLWVKILNQPFQTVDRLFKSFNTSYEFNKPK